MIAWLREEWDKLCWTLERLCSERSAVREDHGRAIRERNEARRVADSLRADLGVTVNQRLDAESVATRLDKELTKVRGIL